VLRRLSAERRKARGCIAGPLGPDAGEGQAERAGDVRPVVPGRAPVIQPRSLTNESVFGLAALPRSLAILGGGAVGCELAQAFARFGPAVYLVEAEDRLLCREEPEASDVVSHALSADGVKVPCRSQGGEAGPSQQPWPSPSSQTAPAW
jgi:NADPH-dependent 2,4-dienoyl-CoA reductase/sulfur reductase-like enzyme